MPKATRAKDENETPKKRSRKAKPVNGNGIDTVEPVTTAPAIAETISQVSAVKTVVSSASLNPSVPEELVRRRAYELYLQRRGQGGSAEQDWFQALREISSRYA